MTAQSEEEAVYNLLIDDETQELRPKVDKDKDGKWNLKEIQDFATATNGRPFEDSVIDEIVESFEVDSENNLLYSGFYQMYYMQTISDPEETLKDFKKHMATSTTNNFDVDMTGMDELNYEDHAKQGIIDNLNSLKNAKALEEFKILVIGAGGLGCEILKNLALTGFKHLHVIDMDTIDLSNLNRQFLFRKKDIGQSKAIVAAKFVMSRVPNVEVVPYFGKIQDKDDDYYRQFQLVICGLDSIEARRWINAKLIDMFDEDDMQSWKPLIDGGTEGFKGQARVILPTMTSCYECSLDMFNKPTTFPICTIANTPRLPEHCIEWASVLEWPRVWGDKKYDTDNPEDITWLYEQASKRAKQFNITGVTYSLTQGVVKNIIPAIASTNAIIAGNDGIYTYTFEHQKKPECPVCGSESMIADLNPQMTLEELIDWLADKPDA
ncbi:uncharacterized protein BX663DRAFT_529662 [Cokeromyces recurvatus]|uniref:uncharacterized protein n=1 Tax=Cokeromyces recurvatus TaxID=90255 RepID=UPI00221EA081|nr:uncharacterized protein BX663DRAFT_529662 [Cokeromyces recurvatus]KAI7905442.1 hypothetical protein BX663DRAFT_529662 [Cokeromyces recurvatus]